MSYTTAEDRKEQVRNHRLLDQLINKISNQEPVFFTCIDAPNMILELLEINGSHGVPQMHFVNRKTRGHYWLDSDIFLQRVNNNYFTMIQDGDKRRMAHPLQNNMHHARLQTVQQEADVIVKPGHNYLFRDPTTYQLVCGYCIDKTHRDASFIMENTYFSGWPSGENSGVVHYDQEVLKDLIFKDLGSSPVAKKLRELVITNSGSLARAYSHAVVSGYGTVVVLHLKVDDNNIRVYFKSIDSDGSISDTTYRAWLSDYLKVAQSDVEPEEDDPLEEISTAQRQMERENYTTKKINIPVK